MMKEIDDSSACERAGDLVSVLYGEATEREQREFELHLKQCGNCRAEFAAFTDVRESIAEWRDEALNGFVSSPMITTPRRKSAVAALRQFFALSPWWMKGAVGFAAVVFCVLIALAWVSFSSRSREVPIAEKKYPAVYTKEDVDRAVADALAKQESLADKSHVQISKAPKPTEVTSPSPAKSSSPLAESKRPARAPHERRPFSRAEREQLAAELRLLSTADESEPDLDR